MKSKVLINVGLFTLKRQVRIAETCKIAQSIYCLSLFENVESSGNEICLRHPYDVTETPSRGRDVAWMACDIVCSPGNKFRDGDKLGDGDFSLNCKDLAQNF